LPYYLAAVTGDALDLFEQIVQEQPLLQNLPTDNGPTWAELTSKWGEQR
jgi:hypothetical protein